MSFSVTPPMLRMDVVAEHPIEIKNRSMQIQLADEATCKLWYAGGVFQVGDHFVKPNKIIKIKNRGHRWYVLCTGTIEVRG